MEGHQIKQTTPENKIKIEHLSGLDVVLNLDSEYPDDLTKVLDILKNQPPAGPLSFLAGASFGADFKDGKFFIKIKHKSTAQRNVNFALGRSKDDPIDQSLTADFDKEARYAHSSILNELTLSPRIKRLVSLSEFQELAKKHGFSCIKFSEPVAGVVEKYAKYLVYRNIKSVEVHDSLWRKFRMGQLTDNLRNLFMANGIVPHDLRPQQFLVAEENGKKILYLIDIEAYTRKK